MIYISSNLKGSIGVEIFIAGVAIISIVVFIFLNSSYISNKSKRIKNEISFFINDKENLFPTIQIIENENFVPLEQNKIIESDIKQAISTFDNSIPNFVEIGQNIKNATEMLNSEKTFFSSAKKGTENMMKVKGSNEVYGIQMKGKKIGKQTKFLNEEKLVHSYGKNAIVNASFSAAAMVVGQYYMNEINNKMDVIKNDIQGISDFLDSEYKSKLEFIISKIREIIDNKIEILGNNYLRDKRYDEILNLETKCTELLGQANEMIKTKIIDEEIDYKKYEEYIKEIQKWFQRQQLLQSLLLEIENLRYVLAYGNESSKLSHTQYNNYLNQINSVNEKLENWHKINAEKLGIDKKSKRRKTSLFKIRKNTIGRINEDWAYRKLKDDIVAIMECQTNIKKQTPYINKKQDEKIKIQKYKGEYYNLLNNK